MTEPHQFCEVIITGPDQTWLIDLTRQLISERLAACGHHTPIRSVYTWAGAIHDERETRLALHTQTSHVPAISAAVRAGHPYDVPCIIAVPLTHVDPDYAAWILASTSPAD